MYPGPDPGVSNRSKYEKIQKIMDGEASPRGFITNPSKARIRTQILGIWSRNTGFEKG
jgi:hypothetical protein